MNLLSIFPTTIGKFELGRAFIPEEMAFVNSQPTHKNMGNTTSDNRYVLRDDTLKSLSTFIESAVAQYLQAIYAPKHNVSLRVTQSWLNYTKPGEFHHKHAHPNSFISGVLYVKAKKETDKIHFYKEGYQQIKVATDNWNVHNSESWWFDVGEGDLMIFPSHLTHMVEPVQGEDTRVSLSFNTFPVGYVGEEQSLTALYV